MTKDWDVCSSSGSAFHTVGPLTEMVLTEMALPHRVLYLQDLDLTKNNLLIWCADYFGFL